MSRPNLRTPIAEEQAFSKSMECKGLSRLTMLNNYRLLKSVAYANRLRLAQPRLLGEGPILHFTLPSVNMNGPVVESPLSEF